MSESQAAAFADLEALAALADLEAAAAPLEPDAGERAALMALVLGALGATLIAGGLGYWLW